MGGARFRRVGMSLAPTELDRARRAALVRGMTTSEFFRQAVVSCSDETLGSRRFESEPYARRTVDSFFVFVK